MLFGSFSNVFHVAFASLSLTSLSKPQQQQQKPVSPIMNNGNVTSKPANIDDLFGMSNPAPVTNNSNHTNHNNDMVTFFNLFNRKTQKNFSFSVTDTRLLPRALPKMSLILLEFHKRIIMFHLNNNSNQMILILSFN